MARVVPEGQRVATGEGPAGGEVRWVAGGGTMLKRPTWVGLG